MIEGMPPPPEGMYWEADSGDRPWLYLKKRASPRYFGLIPALEVVVGHSKIGGLYGSWDTVTDRQVIEAAESILNTLKKDAEAEEKKNRYRNL